MPSYKPTGGLVLCVNPYTEGVYYAPFCTYYPTQQDADGDTNGIPWGGNTTESSADDASVEYEYTPPTPVPGTVEILVREGVRLDEVERYVTEWRSPQYVTTGPEIYGTWSNLLAIRNVDGIPAVLAGASDEDFSTRIIGQDFGFDVPTNATILGFEVEVVRGSLVVQLSYELVEVIQCGWQETIYGGLWAIGQSLEGVFRTSGPSTPGTWEDTTADVSGYSSPLWRDIVFGQAGVVLAVIGGSQLLHSFDYGQSWALVPTQDAATDPIDILCADTDGTRVIAGLSEPGNGLWPYKIDDISGSAVTWQQLSFLGQEVGNVRAIGYGPTNTWTAFFDSSLSGGSTSGRVYIYRSTNGGSSWPYITQLKSSIIDLQNRCWSKPVYANGRWVVALVDDRVIGDRVSFIYSSNNGATWIDSADFTADISSAYFTSNLTTRTLCFNSTKGLWAFVADSTLFTSSSGTSWTKQGVFTAASMASISFDQATGDWILFRDADDPGNVLVSSAATPPLDISQWSVVATGLATPSSVMALHNDFINTQTVVTPTDDFRDEGHIDATGREYVCTTTPIWEDYGPDYVPALVKEVLGDPEDDFGLTAAYLNSASFGVAFSTAVDLYADIQLDSMRARAIYALPVTAEAVPSAVGVGLLSVVYTKQGTKVAIGVDGKVLRKPLGGSWTEVTVPTVADLYKVTRIGVAGLLIVGAGGTMLTSSDEGLTWAKLDVQTNQNIYSVVPPNTDDPSDPAVAVGSPDQDILISVDNLLT